MRCRLLSEPHNHNHDLKTSVFGMVMPSRRKRTIFREKPFLLSGRPRGLTSRTAASEKFPHRNVDERISGLFSVLDDWGSPPRVKWRWAMECGEWSMMGGRMDWWMRGVACES